MADALNQPPDTAVIVGDVVALDDSGGFGFLAVEKFPRHALLPSAVAQRGEYYQQRLEAVLGRGNAGLIVTPTRLTSKR